MIFWFKGFKILINEPLRVFVVFRVGYHGWPPDHQKLMLASKKRIKEKIIFPSKPSKWLSSTFGGLQNNIIMQYLYIVLS
ncbi:hypothetical protein BpHYR1_031669 [Brachionus plicatilis]|uniref:Uncharacterized protein n=1 Tax=Brachionus plicatilis TaxID=10195 RepID=A0A3M7PHD8_BRAPC|nr:hypothetical protein BpHYR1_031669 [Brachionus plicatilis]